MEKNPRRKSGKYSKSRIEQAELSFRDGKIIVRPMSAIPSRLPGNFQNFEQSQH